MKFISGPLHGTEVFDFHPRERALGYEFITVPALDLDRGGILHHCYVKTAYWRFQKPLIWYFAWQLASDDVLIAQAREVFGL
jgi:hypothetical protein